MKETIKKNYEIMIDKLINKSYLNIPYYENNLFAYPVADDTIKNLLLDQNETQLIDDYLEKNDREFLIKVEKYREALGNGNFNPYKEYVVRKFYEPCSSFNELNVIFSYKESPILKKNLIHVGDKGSGKTVTQNCWLSDYNQKLEENNFFWVRCDGHKLYQLWLSSYLTIENFKNELNEDRTININEYLNLQLIYVFSKYCIDSGRDFFKKIMIDIDKNNVLVNYPMGRKEINYTEERKLHDAILEINQIIIKNENEKSTTSTGYSYLIDELLKKSIVSHQREKRRWLAISFSLQKFLYDNGYWILKIVDGVDNVHINEEKSIPYYKRMVAECHEFISTKPAKNEIRLLSLRERTLIDINRIPITLTAPDNIKRNTISHTPSCFKEISIKRYDFFKSEYDENSLFGKMFKLVVCSIEKNIHYLHHNNVRTFLYNRSSLILQLYYRYKQRGNSDAVLKPQTIKSLEDRNEFLNGRLFLNSYEDFINKYNIELGASSINLFYFNIDDFPCNTPNQWYGLCQTRILQLLDRNTSISEIDLILFLLHGVKYPKQLIIHSINNLRAFGMIDSQFDSKLNYIISKKGRRFLEKTFSSVDIIYYFALDCPVPSNLIEDGYINAHDNKFSRRTNFPYAAISTSASFIRFLLYINSIESKRLSDNLKNLCFVNRSFPEYLTLPIVNDKIKDLFIESSNNLIDSSDKINLENSEIFIDKINNRWV